MTKIPVRRLLTARTSAFLVGVFIALVAAEVSLRIYNYFRPSLIFRSKPTRYEQWHGAPNTWVNETDRLNSHGYNGHEYTTKKTPGMYRIIGIGDSFAFGVVRQRDNYLTLLEQKLRAAGKSAEVINMGIPATGPPDYLEIVRREGLSLDPDMVLVCFFVGNDFDESRPSPRRPGSGFFVARLLRYMTRRQRAFQGLAIGSPPRVDTAPTFTSEYFRKLEKQRSFIFEKDNAEFETDLKYAMAPLLEINRLCQKRGTKFVVVIIPDELQVNPALRKTIVATLSDRKFDFEQANRQLSSELAKNGISVLDLTPEFESSPQNQSLYKPLDSHWNIAGNTLAADKIFEFLKPRL